MTHYSGTAVAKDGLMSKYNGRGQRGRVWALGGNKRGMDGLGRREARITTTNSMILDTERIFTGSDHCPIEALGKAGCFKNLLKSYLMLSIFGES